MATVTVVNSERTLEIEASSITDGEVASNGHLILTRHDGTPIDMGAVSGVQVNTGSGYAKADVFSYIGTVDPGAVPNGSVWYDPTDVAGPVASDTQKGLVELATTLETTTGTDTQRAVTPAGAAAAITAGIAAVPGAKVQTLAPNANLESALPSAYPLGISLMSLTTSSGWSINSGFGSVMTQRSETDRTVQMAYSTPGGTGTPRSWIRQYHTSNNGGGWTQWSQYNTLYTLVPGSFTQATAMASYPAGWSRLYYTAGTSTSWDFAGLPGEVLTYVDGADFAKQTFTTHSSGSGGAPSMWFRTANSSSGWTAWRKLLVENPSLPKAMAAGRASVTPVANTLTTLVVNFPAGRFSTTPNVVATADTTVPGSQVQEVSISGVSATQFTIYVLRTNTTNTLVQWIATEF